MRLTREALATRRPLFEAAFSANGAYAQPDILVPAEGGGWRIVEVGSSTAGSMVDRLLGLGFESFVLIAAGLKIQGCAILHLDPEYVRQGPLDVQRLFIEQDVTAEVKSDAQGVVRDLSEMRKVLQKPAYPKVAIGPYCDQPHECPLHERCWAFLPEQPVTDLHRPGNKGFRLLASGITDLRGIPADFVLSVPQKLQRKAAIEGKPRVDKPWLRGFVKRLVYPLHFLDFETFSTAVPRFDGLKPYQQVPFQFSLQVVRAVGGVPEPRGFLAEGGNDPRAEFMRQVVAVIEAEGSIVAYNAPFEVWRLRECCQWLPEYTPWLTGLEPRVMDLHEPFREFAYHHSAQHGSTSMKAVLPALTGAGYGDLAIQEGATASAEFLRLMSADLPAEERERVRRQLEAYCARDTEGMVRIVAELYRLTA